MPTKPKKKPEPAETLRPEAAKTGADPAMVFVCWNGPATVGAREAEAAVAAAEAATTAAESARPVDELALADAKFKLAQALWLKPRGRLRSRMLIDEVLDRLKKIQSQKVDSKGHATKVQVENWRHTHARDPAPVHALISEALRKKLGLPEVAGGEQRLVITHGVCAVSKTAWDRYKLHPGVAMSIESGAILGPEATAKLVGSKDQALLEHLIAHCHDPAALEWLRQREAGRGNARARVMAALDKREKRLGAKAA